MKIIVTPHSVPPKYHRSIDEGKQQNKDIACSLIPRPSSILLHSSRSKGRFPIDFTAWSLCRPSLGRRRKGSLVRSCKNWRRKNRPYYLQMTWRCLVFLSFPFGKKHAPQRNFSYSLDTDLDNASRCLWWWINRSIKLRLPPLDKGRTYDGSK